MSGLVHELHEHRAKLESELALVNAQLVAMAPAWQLLLNVKSEDDFVAWLASQPNYALDVVQNCIDIIRRNRKKAEDEE